MAIEKLPECRELIQRAPDVSAMWVELWCEFTDAHKEPINLDFIGRVYDFASWSVNESGNADASMYAVIGFYEELPTNLLVRAEMPRWVSRGDFYRFADVFKTFISEKEFKDLEAEFLKRKSELECESRKSSRKPAPRQ